MKTSPLVCVLLCAGCQTTQPLPNVKPLPEPPPLRGAPGAYAGGPTASDATAENENLLVQSRLLAALVEQNEALTARLQTVEHPIAPPATAFTNAAILTAPTQAPPVPPVTPNDVAPTAPAVFGVPPPRAAVHPTDEPANDIALFTPNADGVIDLTTLDNSAPGSPPNPFAIRTPSARAPRELTVTVQGIYFGASPRALVNERVVEPGDALESLTVSRIEPDAIFLKGDEFNVKLPLGDKPVRLRF